MIIGNFTHNTAQDTYTGELATLEVGARKVVFRPNEAKTDKAPNYRVVSASKTGDVEFGAAWKKRSEEGRYYLSVKLDDPSLRQPINCAWWRQATSPMRSSWCGRETGASRKAQASQARLGAVRKGRPQLRESQVGLEIVPVFGYRTTNES